MKKYVGLSAALLCFSFVALAGNQPVKKNPALIVVGVGENGVSECDAVEGNLVDNCGFESGVFGPWVATGDLSATGVTTRSRHSGTYGVELGPVGSEGFLTQTLATTAGGVYTLSFWLQLGPGTPNSFRVYWDGNLVYEVIDGAPFAYVQVTIDALEASTDGTDLMVAFYHPPDWWFLDDISVVPSL